MIHRAPSMIWSRYHIGSGSKVEVKPRMINKYMYLFIYLLFENLLPPQRGRHAPTPRKERKRKTRDWKDGRKKKDRATEGETPHPKPGNGCAHRGGRTDGGKKKRVTKKQFFLQKMKMNLNGKTLMTVKEDDFDESTPIRCARMRKKIKAESFPLWCWVRHKRSRH